MRIIIVTLPLLSGAVFFGAENATALGCPSGQREMGQCIAGPKPPSRGVRFGRKPKLTKHQQAEALARVARGETLTAIAKSYNVSHMTICRLQA